MTKPVETVVEELLHYGVKGMKWGVRRKLNASSRVTLAKNGNSAKAYGGANRKMSQDAKQTMVIGQIAKKSGYQALTNRQLEVYIKRLTLEANAKRLSEENLTKAGILISEILNGAAKQKR